MTADLMVVLARLISGTTARWIGCGPDTRQRIYFANHTSNLDALLVWTSLPKPIRERTRPVAAQDYWTSNRFRHWIAKRVFNAVLIERKKVTVGNNPLDLLLAALDEKYSLIIFPEGGRHDGVEAGPFKSGIYHLGKKRPDVELVPVYIDNANRILPKGEVLPVPLLSSLTFGAPLRVQADEVKLDFLERARAAVNELRIT